MTDKKEPSTDDVKGIVALAVLVLYIILSVGVLGFNLNYLLALITFFIVIFGATLQSERSVTVNRSTTKQKDPKIVNIIALLAWVAALFAVLLNALPDMSGRVIFIMFAAAISTSMAAKDIVLFLGLSFLTAYFFASGVLATMVLIVTALFAYACRQGAAFGAIMMVPLLMVGWIAASGWGAAITQQVNSFSTQLSVTTGFSTEGIGTEINAALNNTWLMLTNPNKWYEKQFAEQGTRDQGLTSAALEIMSIEPLPKTVYPKESVDVIFSLENKGTKEATKVVINSVGNTFTDACGSVMGIFCDPACEGYTGDDCSDETLVGKIAPLEKYYGSISFRAPECPGTYKIETQTAYNYEADATLNLQLIARDYYEDLLRNEKLVWVNELSTASAGPFKVTMRTDRQQPIPITVAGNINDPNNMQVFKIYFGIVLEHAGKAILTPNANNPPVTIYIPKDLELVDTFEDGTPRIDESCSLTYAERDATGNYLSQYRGIAIDEYITKRNDFRTAAEATLNDYIKYLPIDLIGRDPVVIESGMRMFGCRFRFSEDKKKSISQTSTILVRSNIKYRFEYSKLVSVSVKQPGPTIAETCKKDAEVLRASAISPLKTTPQTKIAIIDAFAQRIYACYLKYKGSISLNSEEKKCEEIKVNIAGCVDDKITAGDIKTKVTGEPYTLTGVSSDTGVEFHLEFFKPEKTIDVFNDAEDNTELFSDRKIYVGNIYYTSGAFGLNKIIRVDIASESKDASCPK
ncbi:hypothetical protein L6303_05570 [archaeon]|nr:hypothetical protein [Nanoarchaeota archaeon]MBU4300545.1 hypothetical protein [Nanoarchaeota archaeon]MBU4452081.1 hypothetical protein [Nanoarchaeota archaeon]MCG2724186.1 hypothetical protein [archaeon]